MEFFFATLGIVTLLILVIINDVPFTFINVLLYVTAIVFIFSARGL